VIAQTLRGHLVATDYDTPRRNESDEPGAVDELTVHRARVRSGSVDIDTGDSRSTDSAPDLSLDLLDGLGDDGTGLPVQPIQVGEFACVSCFLVHPSSRLAARVDSQLICRDCA
jgi:hypothetical protein